MNLRNLLQTRGSTCGSFYVISQGRIHRQWELWNKYLPKIHPYYAVKCNSDTNIIRWLGALGSGFDCASAREMEACEGVVDIKKVVFANPCKTANDIEVARNSKVSTTTIDSCEELDKMRDRAYMPELLLRIAVDDAASDTPFSKKFGLEDWADVKRLYQAATSKGFRVTGFSFHVGSGCHDFTQYERALAKVDCFWSSLRSLGAKHLETIDIGGGFRSEESAFMPAATSILKGVDALDAAKGATLIAEPGRFFATPSQDLFVKVIGKKPGLGGKGWRYTIDESVYGQFSCIPFDGQKPPFARIGCGLRTRTQAQGILFGRTCDSLDVIAYGSELEELEIDDWLYFPHMGAYTTVSSSEFNGFPKPSLIVSTLETAPESNQLIWQKGVEYALEIRNRI